VVSFDREEEVERASVRQRSGVSTWVLRCDIARASANMEVVWGQEAASSRSVDVIHALSASVPGHLSTPPCPYLSPVR